MIEYIYKGFKLSYKITASNSSATRYQAKGNAIYLLKPSPAVPAKTFHTEQNTHSCTENEIKTLLENYVNGELTKLYNRKNYSQPA